MARFLIPIFSFTLSCTAWAAQQSAEPKSNPHSGIADGTRQSSTIGAKNRKQVGTVVSVRLVPLNRVVQGGEAVARLSLRNTGSRAVALLLDLPGTLWLRNANELYAASHPVRPGDMVCLDEQEAGVRLDPGEVMTKEIRLETLFENMTADIVGTTIRLPIVQIGHRCEAVGFVRRDITIRVVAYSDSRAVPERGPVPMPLVVDRELNNLIRAVYERDEDMRTRLGVGGAGPEQSIQYGAGSLADVLRWHHAAGELVLAAELAKITESYRRALDAWELAHRSEALGDQNASAVVREDLAAALTETGY